MAAFYFDTSALIKRYVTEPGSTWVRQLCELRESELGAQINVVIMGSVTIVETAAALSILERRNIISRKIAEHAYENFFVDFRNEYQITNITSDLLLNVADLARRYPLRAYDAVQLALALATKEILAQDKIDLTFVSGDKELLQAAQAEDLAVENPFTYSQLDNPPKENSQ